MHHFELLVIGALTNTGVEPHIGPPILQDNVTYNSPACAGQVTQGSLICVRYLSNHGYKTSLTFEDYIYERNQSTLGEQPDGKH
jgi:hypothetical protein